MVYSVYCIQEHSHEIAVMNDNIEITAIAL